MVHHSHAYVARVLIGKQRIGVIDAADKNAIENGERELPNHQPPESGLHRLMVRNGLDDAVNNKFGDPQQAYGKQGRENS